MDSHLWGSSYTGQSDEVKIQICSRYYLGQYEYESTRHLMTWTKTLSNSDNPVTIPASRRSSRTFTTLSHLDEFVYSLTLLKDQAQTPSTPLNAYFTNTRQFSLTSLGPNSQQVMQNISHDREPDSLRKQIWILHGKQPWNRTLRLYMLTIF